MTFKTALAKYLETVEFIAAEAPELWYIRALLNDAELRFLRFSHTADHAQASAALARLDAVRANYCA